MDVEGRTNTARNYDVQSEEEEMMDLRRGPWTVEEDFALINYIAHHGEGRWNSLARSAGNSLSLSTLLSLSLSFRSTEKYDVMLHLF